MNKLKKSLLISLVCYSFSANSNESSQFCNENFKQEIQKKILELKYLTPPDIFYGCTKQSCQSDCEDQSICRCQCVEFGCLKKNVVSNSQIASIYLPYRTQSQSSYFCINRNIYMQILKDSEAKKNNCLASEL